MFQYLSSSSHFSFLSHVTHTYCIWAASRTTLSWRSHPTSLSKFVQPKDSELTTWMVSTTPFTTDCSLMHSKTSNSWVFVYIIMSATILKTIAFSVTIFDCSIDQSGRTALTSGAIMARAAVRPYAPMASNCSGRHSQKQQIYQLRLSSSHSILDQTIM